jgi:hypothetical protein
MRLLITFLATLAAPFATTAAAAAQAVPLTGTALDQITELPVARAEVQLLTANERRVAAVTADSAGGFTFEQVRAGTYRLRARAAGYHEVVTPPFGVAGTDTVNVIVRLGADAVPLAPLEVTTRATPVHRHPGLQAFYRRAELRMGGTFLTREQIDERNPERVADLFHMIGSFTVNTAAQTILNERSVCAPQVFLDGMRIAPGGRLHVEWGRSYEALDAFTIPVQLEGIEVYAGAATTPAEFTGSMALCGTVVLWTRRQ